MRNSSAQITLTLVFLILGALVMTQFRTQRDLSSAKVAESAADQATIIASLADANDELRREAQGLAQQEADYERAIDLEDPTGLLVDLNRLRVINGETEASGPGVELRIQGPLRAEEILDVVNEFRNAGAEALAVCGTRIVAWSAIGEREGGVTIDGGPIEAPIVFEAIGETDTLDRALGRVGGMVSYLKTTYPAATITLTKRTKLTLPATSVDRDLRFTEIER